MLTYYFFSDVPADSTERCFTPICHTQCTVTYCLTLRMSLARTVDTQRRASNLPLCCYVNRNCDTDTRIWNCKYRL